jgi:parallel beta-helix repeat protein
MPLLFSASAEKCDLLNPNACGLYDCGGNSWSPDEIVGNGDNLSLRSGQVNLIGSSRVCMKVIGPGLVKFVWKVDPLAQHVGTLGFWVDNAQVAVCKSQGWAPISYTLREKKEYDLAWQYYKFKSIPAGMGAGWIDDLEIENNWPTSHSPNITQIISPTPTQIVLNQTSQRPDEERNLISRSIPANPPNISVNLTLLPSMNISLDLTNAISQLSEMESNSCNPGNMNITIINYINNTEDTEKKEPPKPPQLINVSPNATSVSGWAKDIKDALKSINETGTIRVFNGTYYAPLEIDKCVHILGENNTTTKIIAEGCKGIIISRGKNVSIENISIINIGDTSKSATGIHVKSKGDFALMNCSIMDFSCGIMINESSNITISGNYINSSGEANYHCIPIDGDNIEERKIRNCSIGIILDMGPQKSWNALIESNVIELNKNNNESKLLTLGICYKGDGLNDHDKKRCSWVRKNTIIVNYYKALLFSDKYDSGIAADGTC